MGSSKKNRGWRWRVKGKRDVFEELRMALVRRGFMDFTNQKEKQTFLIYDLRFTILGEDLKGK
ncbi:MAG: hypothetical protein ACO1NX_09930 [Chitinophagaceae bacterium]